MTWDRFWQDVRQRRWEEICPTWLNSMPVFGDTAARPTPGVENLASISFLQGHNEKNARLPDIDGLRMNVLSESVFLYHKCSHALLAVERLSSRGMDSWAGFNAYHSAFLGARAIMSLLGVVFPKVGGTQLLIDVFPEPVKRSSQRKIRIATDFDEFICSKLPTKIDQRYMWEVFLRVIRVTRGAWSSPLVDELKSLDWEEITPPRNAFLYKPYYWPEVPEDLVSDANAVDWPSFLGDELSEDTDGFLIHLALAIHALLQKLLEDLAGLSGVIAQQLALSRWPSSLEAAEWVGQRQFESRLVSVAA